MTQPTQTKAGKKTTGKKKGGWIRKFILFLLVMAVIGAAGWAAYRRLKSEYTVVYDEYTANIGSISNSLSFNGNIQAINNVTYTAGTATTVRTVYVAEGAQVKAGDKIMRLTSGQTVEAGFDGTINQLYFAEGDKVSAGDSLAQLVDFTHVKVSIRVDEYDIGDVQVGTKCRVTTTATDETFPCSIASINYVSSSTGSVAYYTATAYVDVSDTVYPGMQVTVTIPQEEAADVVVLKADAISFDTHNQAFVYQPDETGKMTEKRITTGVSNGNYVEIKEGLRNGEVVYAVSKEKAETATNILSTIFGGQMIMNPNQNNRMNQRQWNTNQNNRPGGNTPTWPGGGGTQR